MRTIDLRPYNRENRGIKLVPKTDGVWEFSTSKEDEWLLEYMRVGYLDDSCSKILFIDPSGGPMLCNGDEISDIIIDKITNEDGKFLIYAKDKEEI